MLALCCAFISREHTAIAPEEMQSCQGTLDISGSPNGFQKGSWENIQGNLDMYGAVSALRVYLLSLSLQVNHALI